MQLHEDALSASSRIKSSRRIVKGYRGEVIDGAKLPASTSRPRPRLARALAASGAIPGCCSTLLLRPSSSLRERPIQSLWAGYGTINELELEVEAGDSGEGKQENRKKKKTTTGHRQARQARREATPATSATSASSPRTSARRRSTCTAAVGPSREARRSPSRFWSRLLGDAHDRRAAPFSLTLVLSDLRPTHPNFSRGGLRPEHSRPRLRWLARFHAIWWGLPRERTKRSEWRWRPTTTTRPTLISFSPRARRTRRNLLAPRHPPRRVGSHPGRRLLSYQFEERGEGIADDLKAEARQFSTLVPRRRQSRKLLLRPSSSSSSSSIFSCGFSATLTSNTLVAASVRETSLIYFPLRAPPRRKSSSSRALIFISSGSRMTSALSVKTLLPINTPGISLQKHFRLSCADFYRFMAGWVSFVLTTTKRKKKFFFSTSKKQKNSQTTHFLSSSLLLRLARQDFRRVTGLCGGGAAKEEIDFCIFR